MNIIAIAAPTDRRLSIGSGLDGSDQRYPDRRRGISPTDRMAPDVLPDQRWRFPARSTVVIDPPLNNSAAA